MNTLFTKLFINILTTHAISAKFFQGVIFFGICPDKNLKIQ